MRPTIVAVVLSASLLASAPWDFWGFLSSIWNSSFVENGCIADPSGGCRPAATIHNGCGADPNGGCGADPNGRNDSFVENGCGADPSGGCRPATVDAGCGADPSGCPHGS